VINFLSKILSMFILFPVFVDVDSETCMIDPKLVEKSITKKKQKQF